MKNSTLDLDELAKQNPILTEEDLEDCYTFEEAVQYDHRHIMRIFYIYLLSKQAFFMLFYIDLL